MIGKHGKNSIFLSFINVQQNQKNYLITFLTLEGKQLDKNIFYEIYKIMVPHCKILKLKNHQKYISFF